MQVSFTLRKNKINKNGLMPVLMTITFKGERVRKDVKDVRIKEILRRHCNQSTPDDMIAFKVLLTKLSEIMSH